MNIKSLHLLIIGAAASMVGSCTDYPITFITGLGTRPAKATYIFVRFLQPLPMLTPLVKAAIPEVKCQPPYGSLRALFALPTTTIYQHFACKGTGEVFGKFPSHILLVCSCLSVCPWPLHGHLTDTVTAIDLPLEVICK